MKLIFFKENGKIFFLKLLGGSVRPHTLISTSIKQHVSKAKHNKQLSILIVKIV
jgi:hypothetical protein